MNIQTVTAGLVGILIAVLVVVTVALPVIDDSVNGTSFTGTNTNADSTYTYVASSPTFSISKAADSATVTYTINGQSATDGGRKEIITDAFAFRWTAAGEVNIWNFAASTYTSLQASGSVSVTVTAGSYSIVVNDASPVTGTCTMALLPDSHGTWGYFGRALKATIGQDVIVGHLTNASTLGPINFAKAKDGEITSWIVEPVKASGGSLVAEPEMTYDITWDEIGEGQAVGYYSQMEYSWGSSSHSAIRIYAPLDFESTAVDAGGVNSTLLYLIPVLLLVVAVMMAVRLLREA